MFFDIFDMNSNRHFFFSGEFFSREAKELSSSLVTAFNWACAFLVSKFGTDIEDALGTDGEYFFFAGVCVFATFFVAFVVPETKGRSAEDMREYFRKGSAKKRKWWSWA